MAIAGFIPTARYLTQLSGGSVTNVYTNIAIYSPNGSQVSGYENIPISTMTVTASRSNTQRTTVSMTVPLNNDPPYWPVPQDLSSPLSPNGNELFITTGFNYNDGTSDTFLQGKFPIVTTNAAAQGVLAMSVTADDRAWSIGRRGLTAPYTVPEDDEGNPTGSITETILELLSQNVSALPQITYNIASTDQLAPANTYSIGQDPWQASTDLATSTGWDLYAGWDGSITAAPPPTTGTPIWYFSTIPGNQISTTASRQLTADSIYNDFIVITANSDSYDYFTTNPELAPPVQAEEADYNPASPTYYLGNFGDIPQYIQSSVATNFAAADAEASYDLTVSLGQVDTIPLTGPINPAVQIDDFCLVYSPRMGLSAPGGTLYVVDGFTTTYAINGNTQYQLRRVISI